MRSTSRRGRSTRRCTALEKAGLLASSWSRDAGRRRRVYEITRAGERTLRERKDEWRGFTAAVDAVMAGTA